MAKGSSATANKISIKKVGWVTLAILAFLLIVYVFAPTASCSERYESWIKVNDKDWFEQCSSHPGGSQHKTQWGETIYYGWEKNKSCVWKEGGGAARPSPIPTGGGGGGAARPSPMPNGGGGGRSSGGFPVCSSNSDPDGDGWGWENNASCKMPWLADKDEGRSNSNQSKNNNNYNNYSNNNDPEKANRIRQEQNQRGGKPMVSDNKKPWWRR
jgi:hypothetical protein